MNDICKNLNTIKKTLPKNVTLVAVSKTKPIDDILKAYHCKHKHFGENKVQELIVKQQKLPDDIHWHMIGHLQRNKVKYIIPFIYLIHSVDNLKLIKEIDKQSAKNNKKTNILLQVKIASEETKFGMSPTELEKIIKLSKEESFPHVRIKGFMGMATHTDDRKQIADEFQFLHQLFIKYKTQLADLKYLSMGMSNDYPIAIDNGSNMIRIGSAVFGSRNYHSG